MTLEIDMSKQATPSALATYLSRRTSVPHSVHLGRLSDEQLSRLHDTLIFEFDAHRATVFGEGRRVSEELISYMSAVRIEVLTRTPFHKARRAAERYETRRPVNVLRRAVDKQSGGSCSLADLQAEYGRQR